MSTPEVTNLLRQAPLSFVGTVEHIGAATMANVPITDRTAVVRVDFVLHAPPAFARIRGQRITMQLASDKPVPAVGERAAFFAQGQAFAESLAVEEVGRLPVEAVEPQLSAAVEAGQPTALESLQQQANTVSIREHADGADAVVVGRISKLERAFGPVASEHDPDWWKATLDVLHVEKGDVSPGPVTVLYANSIDVRWRHAPKPKASQGGLWFLHATQGDLRAVAPFAILHPQDFQPTQVLDDLRGNRG